MSDRSRIEWTEATWNPVTGCTKVSPGCDHCYAERIIDRFKGKGAFGTVVLNEDRLSIPLRWRKPRRVFVNSMSDLFHEDVPDDFIVKVFDVMGNADRHTFQVLTKRHARMRSFVSKYFTGGFGEPGRGGCGPLRNVWLGVSVEDQKWADIRIPALLATPAAVRWLSCEPLLGPIDLYETAVGPLQHFPDEPNGETGRIDWIVCGGESGPGARPMHPDWARSLRQQCQDAKVPFFFKQWGEFLPLRRGEEGDAPFLIVPEYGWSLKGSFTRGASMRRVGKKNAGRELDGRTWDEYPEAKP